MLATDHSVWSLPPADTLTFVIASVADLADATLARRFDIAGDSVNHLTPEREEYAQGLEALSNREYQRALGILEKYPDYNTAVALTCLGYHAKSEDLLKQLPQTAAVEYLRAIVNVRLKTTKRQQNFCWRHAVKILNMYTVQKWTLILQHFFPDLWA